MSRKVLAVIELDADGTLHFTARDASDADVLDWALSARSRRELTWFPYVHKFQTGTIRDIVDGVGQHTRLGIEDTLQDSLVHLVTGKKGS